VAIEGFRLVERPLPSGHGANRPGGLGGPKICSPQFSGSGYSRSGRTVTRTSSTPCAISQSTIAAHSSYEITGAFFRLERRTRGTPVERLSGSRPDDHFHLLGIDAGQLQADLESPSPQRAATRKRDLPQRGQEPLGVTAPPRPDDSREPIVVLGDPPKQLRPLEQPLSPLDAHCTHLRRG
jgi:hypothetical protein